jgi:hypothetical protein
VHPPAGLLPIVYNRRSEPEPIELKTGLGGSAYADPPSPGSIMLGATHEFIGEYRTTPNQMIFKPLKPIPVEDSRMVLEGGIEPPWS